TTTTSPCDLSAGFLKELTASLDGIMESATRVELEEHLQWCHNCYVVGSTTKMTIEIYRNNEVYDLRDALRSHLQTAIIARCRGKKDKCEAQHLWQIKIRGLWQRTTIKWARAP